MPNRRLVRIAFVVPMLFVGALTAGQPEPFIIGPLRVEPGQMVSDELDVPAGVDAATTIPITVVHGASAGPVLALVAGTHGYEYAPILALQKVRRDLDPARLAGTVVLVHIANVPSFLGRTIYYGPVDGKNLNRVYPGRADGTVSERIAHALMTEVIRRADYVVDMHCGDGNEALRPYLYNTVTGNEELDRASRAMAVAFGLDQVVVEQRWSDEAADQVYTEWVALGLGKPAMTTETGQLGSVDPRWVGLAERGAWNLLRHLGMVEGEVQAAPAVVWLGEAEVVRSPATGLFRPAVQAGDAVAGGGLLGELVDFFGDTIEEIRAPFAGVTNYVVSTPPVSAGEPLAMVSKVLEGRPGGEMGELPRSLD